MFDTFKSKNHKVNSYIRLLHFVKPYWKVFVAALLCMIGVSATNLYLPWIIKDVIDQVLEDKNVGMLYLIIVSIIVVFFIRGATTFAHRYLMGWIGESVVRDLRDNLYDHLQKLPIAYFDKRRTGEIMSNLTNDIGALQSAMTTDFITLVQESAIFIGSFAAMIYLQWKLTILCLVIVPLCSFAIKYFGKKLHSSGRSVQEKVADVTAMLQESISGIRIIRSFNRGSYETKRFANVNKRSFKANVKAIRQTSQLTPVVEFLAALAITVIMWYGGMSVINGIMSAGELVAFLIYAVNLANPIKRIADSYGRIQKSLAAADRVFAILDVPVEDQGRGDEKPLVVTEGRVVAKHVAFSYEPGHPVLTDLNFVANPGDTVAIVGPSGAGKSTIANLLPRFYEISSGEIDIDGMNIQNATLGSLRDQIGLVPQDTLLFNTSIKENVRYGRLDATDDEIWAAVRAANAEKFINELPNGIETRVGDRGLVLSGGQRQRIAIARAILKNPKILILDEATSALDTESEKVVQDALDKLMVGRTAFVIAHRLSTIRDADQILVLNNGVIAERGTHDELMAKHGLYHELYTMNQKMSEAEEEDEELAGNNAQ